ncbi:hypothetical protein [Arhodomonas sp. AD133]|uniref:hypothetical protein n=1 Tax=Arhodomonas sp. AD133 TaxID=3415009 RepID=UPI003EB8C548
MQRRVTGLDRVAGGWWWLRLAGLPTDFDLGQYVRLDFDEQTCFLPLTHASAREGWAGGLLPPGGLPAGLTLGATVTTGPLTGDALPQHYPSAPLLFAEGAGIGPVLALAERTDPPPVLVILGAWRDVPARLCPSHFLLPGLPPEAIAGVKSLEDASIPARVASMAGGPGCFEGEGLTLLRHYLAELPAVHRQAMPLAACLPEGRLEPWLDELEGLLASVHLAEMPAPHP